MQPGRNRYVVSLLPRVCVPVIRKARRGYLFPQPVDSKVAGRRASAELALLVPLVQPEITSGCRDRALDKRWAYMYMDMRLRMRRLSRVAMIKLLKFHAY